MHPYLVPITRQFRQAANKTKAVSMKAYLLNQFDFFGIPTPERRALCKAHYKNYPLTVLPEIETIVKECFNYPEREYHYFAIELFAFYKKLWNKKSIQLIAHCLVHKSWWDSVDHIASDWLSTYFLAYPEQIIPVTGNWNRSENIWLQRSSIMFQKKYKDKTNTQLLSRYILNCSGSEEFFIRKAIGWALREYAKTDPVWVKKFVTQHPLSPLSKKEALKHDR